MEIDSRRIRRLIRRSRSRERMLDRAVRSQAWLDPVAVSIQKAVGAAYEALGPPGQSIKNVMHGTTGLGHPLHPALTDVPVGAWTVGVLADWLFVATGRVPAVAGDLALAIGVAGGIVQDRAHPGIPGGVARDDLCGIIARSVVDDRDSGRCCPCGQRGPDASGDVIVGQGSYSRGRGADAVQRCGVVDGGRAGRPCG